MPTADWAAIQRTLRDQDGLITRAQAVSLGARVHDVERMLRRRLWVRLVDGVYVDHTGDLSWQQRAWLGVLHFAPAALTHSSALRAVHGPGWRGVRDTDPIEIAVAGDRHVARLKHYRLVRTRGLEQRVLWNSTPPRMRYEEAVIDVAAEAPSDLAAVGVLADACGSRRTTAARLLDGLSARPRVRRRKWLVDVLDDVAQGTCSTLEHAYLARVERAHGLPRGVRQHAERLHGRRMYRDVRYQEQDLDVELDGLLFHDTTHQRDLDLERDLAAAVDGRSSVRLGWGQCTDHACRTAGQLAQLLQARGWRGSATRCGADCRL